MKSIAWMVAVCGLPGLIASLLCSGGVWVFPWQVPAVATLIVLVPAAVTLTLMLVLRGQSAEERLAFILAVTFLRMGFALGGGILAYYLVPAIRDQAVTFAGWGMVLYLVSLAWETAFGIRLGRADRNPKPAEMDL